MKLFELLDAPQPQPTPAQLAALRWIDIARSIRAAIRDGVGQIAADSATIGKSSILKAMPPEAANAFAEALPIVQNLWEATAEMPFPELPDEPAKAAEEAPE